MRRQIKLHHLSCVVELKALSRIARVGGVGGSCRKSYSSSSSRRYNEEYKGRAIVAVEVKDIMRNTRADIIIQRWLC